MVDPLSIMDEVLAAHQNAGKWDQGRYGRIKILANTLVGNVGEEFTLKLCKSMHLPVELPRDVDGKKLAQNPWDVKIANIDFELKTATEDVSGSFQFNHIRYHRPYDALLCIGITPDTVLFNMWTKAEVTTGRAGTLVSMEKGANASYKLTKRPGDMKNFDFFNGELEDLAAVLQSSRRSRH